MKLKAAFMFVTSKDESEMKNPQYTWVCTAGVDLLVIPVVSYSEAVSAAKRAVDEFGCAAIELCGGFGNEGVSLIAKAVNVPVGVVRFDIHPGLGKVSGDTLFNT